ncbi:hypothetical protein TSUD_219940 [Trifolium subterraneum]|uniref:Reverse transcriptase domain-containing protein n=1 Tax=Trifolium subterraneum TaxID=3900 RepID=A0A2Z6N7U7_TRISU|nr:hypothetical protein TSUD_219940 [Trifolium subterraneum]
MSAREREVGREREPAIPVTAFIESKAHMRGVLTDSGEWIEVRQRHRREPRQVDEGNDRLCYTSNFHERSFSQPRHSYFHERHVSISPAHDHDQIGRTQSRFNREWDCEFRRRRNKYFSHHVFGFHRSTSGAGHQFHHSASRQQQRREATKGFEVCGMLEDVYVANKRNRYGEPYSFVKFSNVRDVTKMTKALNVVWFGHFRVRASVAKFDRHDTGGVRKPEKDKVRPVKGANEPKMNGGTTATMKPEAPKSGVVHSLTKKPKKKGGGVTIPAKEGHGPSDGPNAAERLNDVAQEKEGSVLIRKYHTEIDGVKWAKNGVVATLVNGEAIPVVQKRISDAGFDDLVLIPMGVDKGPDVMPYQRGAWVRVYRVPVHAWKVNFLKLCVFECGGFLHADSCSVDRDRLDFARVLIATPELDIIKRVENILVDGSLVEIKVVEQWGYAMGEDTCLFEEECEAKASQHDLTEERDDLEARRNVDILIEKIAYGLEKDYCNDLQGQRDEDKSVQLEGSHTSEGESAEDDVRSVDPTRPVSVCGESTTNQSTQGEFAGGILRTCVSFQPSDAQESPITRKVNDEQGWGVSNPLLSKRSRSSPLVASHSVILGSWSLEWLHDHDHGEAGHKVGRKDPRKRKEGGLLHHPVHSLKKVDRLPSKDRSEVLKVLNRNVRRWGGRNGSVSHHASSDGSSSSASSNNVWQNWVAMQGTEQMAMDDVCGLGKAIGVKMKIISWNIRGLGRLEKRKEVCKLVGDLKPLILCLLETKLQSYLFIREMSSLWQTFPNCEQVAKLRGLSDHFPLVLSANEDDWGPRPLRMLKCWKDVAGYNLFVREKWNSLQVDGWGGYVLKEKLKMIKVHVQNLASRIDCLKHRVSELDQKGEAEVLSRDEVPELHGATSDIHSLSRLHASISWQQSRTLWLKEGDAHSKYFHSVLAGHRRRNVISMIQVGGVVVEGVAPIRQTVLSHFASHFNNTNVGRPEAEVKSAVWNCDTFKSPCPDGINFGFIKDFWDELRGDIMRFISDFHRNGKLTKGLNSTFIALIPKVDNPQRLNDFRPISLAGSLHKILAKVLANRLRLVIGSVISESQTTFVKDSQILDDILIANEVVDEGRKSKKELLLFKVDFEKAYDSWIKECVGTTTTSVLVNRSPTDEFPLERGLRQGDPGLNVLMEAMVAQNLFTGYSVGELNPTPVSHLQFADDTLILGVNFNKSLLVGVNIPDSWLGEAASTLCCKDSVLTRLKKRLSGWKSRFLSFGGRLVLLNYVLTSLSVYALSFFKAPSGKWCWRMLVDREGMWFRVLAARYGMERGRLRDREIAGIREGGGESEGGWFGEHVSRRVGNGVGAEGEAWVWRRQLRVWEEEMLGECQNLLSNIFLQAQSSYRWQWQADPDTSYTVRGAYQLLTTHDSLPMDDAEHLIWHPQVPLKDSVFAWRLLRVRLPTKSNLITRGILSPAAYYCVSGYGVAESAQHLFILYSTFGSLCH